MPAPARPDASVEYAPEPRLHEQYSSIEQQEHVYRLGMWVFLASEVLLFSTLFTCYFYYRAMYGHDFVRAVGETELGSGTISTYVLATSSFTMTMALHSVKKNRVSIAAALTGFTALLAATFIALEGTEWSHYIRKGAVPGMHYHYAKLPTYGANVFFTVYFFLTGLHLLHVFGGFVITTTLTVRLRQGAYSSRNHTPVEIGGLFWHFVDVMWFFIFACLYLSRN